MANNPGWIWICVRMVIRHRVRLYKPVGVDWTSIFLAALDGNWF